MNEQREQREQRDNTGVIFENNRRETDRHPDRTGRAMIDGVEYVVSAWTKQGPKSPYITLAFRKAVPATNQSEVTNGRSQQTQGKAFHESQAGVNRTMAGRS